MPSFSRLLQFASLAAAVFAQDADDSTMGSTSSTTTGSTGSSAANMTEAGIVQLTGVDPSSTSQSCVPSGAGNVTEHYFAVVSNGQQVVLSNLTGFYNETVPSYTAMTPLQQNATLNNTGSTFYFTAPANDGGMCVFTGYLAAGNLLGQSNGTVAESGIAQVNGTDTSRSAGDQCAQANAVLDNQTLAFVRTDNLTVFGNYWGMYMDGQPSTLTSSTDGSKVNLQPNGTQLTVSEAQPAGQSSRLQGTANATTAAPANATTPAPANATTGSQSAASPCTYMATVSNGTILGVPSASNSSSSSTSNTTMPPPPPAGATPPPPAGATPPPPANASTPPPPPSARLRRAALRR